MMLEDLDYCESITGIIREEKPMLNMRSAKPRSVLPDVFQYGRRIYAAVPRTYGCFPEDVEHPNRYAAYGIQSDVPVIVAADDLAPSETVQLDKKKILAFVTAGGSESSHTAILARTMGIPAIIGVGDALGEDWDGRTAVVDGSTESCIWNRMRTPLHAFV